MALHFAYAVPSAWSQTIPGSADAGRVDSSPDEFLPAPEKPKIVLPRYITSETTAPEAADPVKFVLKNVVVENMTSFSQSDIDDIFQPFIDKEIQLSRIWEFAGRITERYQADGYFLSRAYVPAQEVEQGTVIIRVIEGYIADVQIEGQKADNYLVTMFKKRISQPKPLKFHILERELLLLNDIPGLSFEAVLGRMEEPAPEGSVRLILKEIRKESRGRILFDNYGSRFTGPHRASFAYEDSFLPLQNTAISGIATIPGRNELWALSFNHEFRVLPEVSLDFSLGHTISEPGFTLATNDIESQSTNWGVGISWQAIRQRRGNLELSLALEGRNVNTDILDTPLTRDRIRVVRAGMNYDGADPFDGYNIVGIDLSHGVNGLGANNPGEANLSRADAKPDFAKLEVSLQHQQFIMSDWLFIGTVMGQRASKALYSSEEFGFGGPSVGRAYDSSEMTGDHGIGGSLEVQYTSLEPLNKFKLTPSAFYDLGKIWNIDQGQADGVSASSAGVGLNLSHPSGITGNLTIAQPLSKAIDTPTYGNNGHNPRVYFQLGWGF